MKILITGICGFVGSSLAKHLRANLEQVQIIGLDNLSRQGAEFNRSVLRQWGIQLFHGDVRMASDLESLPRVDWVIEAAANPSVLAGVDGKSSSRQLVEHNLFGVANTLEFCGRSGAGLVLLSTSRVYSIAELGALPLRTEAEAFHLDGSMTLPPGVSACGVTEEFSTRQPISLYGATKLASETLALEYGFTRGFPVWINRCGVMAGAGQFGTAEQGIFSYWIHAHASGRPLRYIGFGGHCWQVRDALHPEDLGDLILRQIRSGSSGGNRILNASGGVRNSTSLAQLTAWCNRRFHPRSPQPEDRSRSFDVPWLILDSERARRELDWTPRRDLESILQEIACHARENSGWLDQCGV